MNQEIGAAKVASSRIHATCLAVQQPAFMASFLTGRISQVLACAKLQGCPGAQPGAQCPPQIANLTPATLVALTLVSQQLQCLELATRHRVLIERRGEFSSV